MSAELEAARQTVIDRAKAWYRATFKGTDDEEYVAVCALFDAVDERRVLEDSEHTEEETR